MDAHTLPSRVKSFEKIFERFFLGEHVLKMLQFGLQNEESYDAHGGFHSVENPFRIFLENNKY